MKNIAKYSENKIKNIWQNSETFLHYTGHMFGIGAAALDVKSCEKINEFKKRSGKGFIILIPKLSWLDRYGLEYNKKFKTIPQQFWPANITIILKDTKNKFGHLSLNGTVAVRIPDDPDLREFITLIDEPIVSTSVNVSGESPILDYNVLRKMKWFDFSYLPKVPLLAEGKASTIINISGEKLEMIRQGDFRLEDFEQAVLRPKILFICTANICRSPMAEYIAKKIVKEKNLPYRIASAGFLKSGVMISNNSYKVLKEYGYDASAHVSTSLSQNLTNDCWLILTMTKEHKKKLQALDKNIGEKVFTLSEYTGYQRDIADPWGLEISFYRETFCEIKKRIQEMF
jgi:tRNA threonylcarbamoyl adenosine modification protein (Sua5/YciO/YrdC/YwlC family)